MVELVQQLPQREDELSHDVLCLLQGEIIAALEHAGVDAEHCLLGHAHALQGDVVEYVLALLLDQPVDLSRIEDVEVVHAQVDHL